MKVAIVHDWLVCWGGAEDFLYEIYTATKAPIFTLFCDRKWVAQTPLRDAVIITSTMDQIPGVYQYYRYLLPLMPYAIESIDLSGYDLIISSSYCVAKGVMVHPHQKHICYCHTPMRFAWDLEHLYIDRFGAIKRWIHRYFLHSIRTWDVIASNRVDEFIANSSCVAQRIYRFYRRSATVLYQGVDTNFFTPIDKKEGFFVTVSRLVYQKRIDLIIDAFNEMPEKQLIIIGDGPERKMLQKKAKNNIQFLGFSDKETLKQMYQKAKAFVFMSEEDFGIAPIEALACGTPVIAYGKGGCVETITPDVGVLFESQSKEGCLSGIKTFETKTFDPEKIRARALFFSKERFRKVLKEKLITEGYLQ